MKKTVLLIACFLVLFAIEIPRVYFIMPFPGSQRSNSIGIAYFLHNHIWWIRLVLLTMLVYFTWPVFMQGRVWKKIVTGLFILLYGFIFYLVNFRFLADKMFYQPRQKIFATAVSNQVDSNQLVLGITLNGESKAYPIEIIGYHHQVRDTVGGKPVMVTYCTVCRTGRVFDPVVEGKTEDFRLVGMDHFNAMFEDGSTKSWWRQATGEAIAGKQKGKKLPELFSEQMRLGAWISLHPNTMILQPDPNFTKQYAGLKGFDQGTISSGLEKRDPTSWQFKSWVVGLTIDGQSRAYDWNELVKRKWIRDTIGRQTIILVLENDGSSFHAWNTRLEDRQFDLYLDENSQQLKDSSSGSSWNMSGISTAGPFTGKRLPAIPAYQEFWHSWKMFHPATTTYPDK
ncbi:MAG: DUF3179 domain-containing protein [Chitinophagaceae bacterium]|nr:DUF3179 domain-containing protein [Chitinophagaceae bacterium]